MGLGVELGVGWERASSGRIGIGLGGAEEEECIRGLGDGSELAALEGVTRGAQSPPQKLPPLALSLNPP